MDPESSQSQASQEISFHDAHYVYSLRIAQQPLRARTCGFGDKDRRPITHVPCLKMRAVNKRTGEKAKAIDIPYEFFILMADLWDACEDQPQTLVEYTTSATSSLTRTSRLRSYPQRETLHLQAGQQASYFGHQYFAGPPALYPQPTFSQANFQQRTFPAAVNGSGSTGQASHKVPMARALIGNTTATGLVLGDPEEAEDIWFIFPDLSVRIAGSFRLKWALTHVGCLILGHNVHTGGFHNVSHLADVPVLGCLISEVFQVSSPQEFPGMPESTPLEKWFNQQGIKISIRKRQPSSLNSNTSKTTEEDVNELVVPN